MIQVRTIAGPWCTGVFLICHHPHGGLHGRYTLLADSVAREISWAKDKTPSCKSYTTLGIPMSGVNHVLQDDRN